MLYHFAESKLVSWQMILYFTVILDPIYNIENELLLERMLRVAPIYMKIAFLMFAWLAIYLIFNVSYKHMTRCILDPFTCIMGKCRFKPSHNADCLCMLHSSTDLEIFTTPNWYSILLKLLLFINRQFILMLMLVLVQCLDGTVRPEAIIWANGDSEYDAAWLH